MNILIYICEREIMIELEKQNKETYENAKKDKTKYEGELL